MTKNRKEYLLENALRIMLDIGMDDDEIVRATSMTSEEDTYYLSHETSDNPGCTGTRLSQLLRNAVSELQEQFHDDSCLAGRLILSETECRELHLHTNR